MPELPEVEMTRRHLESALVGRTFESVTVTHERTARHNSSPREVEDRLRQRRVDSVGRHGKFLRLGLDDGQVVVAHLGMSGRWAIDSEDVPHTHFRALLDDGTSVSFIDPRTFGFVAVYEGDELGRSGISRLGPDAWTDPPDVVDLVSAFAGRSAPIKALLLDQRQLSGLGNIYADEVLFRARVHPLTQGGALSSGDLERILAASTDVLASAIENGGTTLDDLTYLLPDGRAGENMDTLGVYGRESEPCPVCGTPIERVVVRSRSTHFCPHCQPAR